jgi:hypothetical protein
MKKIVILATAAFLTSGIAFAQTAPATAKQAKTEKKDCCKKDASGATKSCCKKEGSAACCKKSTTKKKA